MANPTAYNLSYDFSAFAALYPNTPLPGIQVDIQLQALELTTDAIIAALADVRRSDGALANGIVTAESLADSLSIGFTLRGEWSAAGVMYVAGDGVTLDGDFYKCLVQHTSSGASEPGADAATWGFLLSFSSISATDGSITSVKLDAGDAAGFLTVLGISNWAVNVAAGINGASAKTTPVDADLLGVIDSAASNVLKKTTFADLATWVGGKLGALVAAASTKTTPVDDDQFGISNSEASNASANLSWANVKAGVWTAFGALVAGGTSKTTPAGADVFALSDSAASSASKKLSYTNLRAAILTDPALVGTITEDVFTITDGAAFAIDPRNGSIQFVTLGANRTPVAANFLNGDCVTLRIADGTARTITWSTVVVVWKGGTAPTLATTGYTEVNLEKSGDVIRGVHVGDFAS